MGVSKAIWIGCEDIRIEFAVSDKQELHYAHSGLTDNSAAIENANKKWYIGERTRIAKNTAAPAIQDQQGLRVYQRGDVANYIAASIFTAISSTSRRRSCGLRL
jgi:hypothetical protein